MKRKYLTDLDILDFLGDADVLRDRLIEAFRSGSDILQRQTFADMLDPKGKTRFHLKVVRRRGNFDQKDALWKKRLAAFEAIYDACGRDGAEAVRQAELSKAEGGLGVSMTTAQKYLADLLLVRKMRPTKPK